MTKIWILLLLVAASDLRAAEGFFQVKMGQSASSNSFGKGTFSYGGGGGFFAGRAAKWGFAIQVLTTEPNANLSDRYAIYSLEALGRLGEVFTFGPKIGLAYTALTRSDIALGFTAGFHIPIVGDMCVGIEGNYNYIPSSPVVNTIDLLGTIRFWLN